MPFEVRIVLVEPREAAIVGAAARAMLNFGIEALTIVAPAGVTPDDEASRWASGADRVLRHAKRSDSIAAAVAGSARSVAIRISSDGDAVFAREALDPVDDGAISFVIEPDERPLNDEEIAAVDAQVIVRGEGLSVPQRVAIVCWEMSDLAWSEPAPAAADAAMLGRIDAGVRTLIETVGLPEEQTLELLRAVEERAVPTFREGTMALGVMRQLDWALGRALGRRS